MRFHFKKDTEINNHLDYYFSKIIMEEEEIIMILSLFKEVFIIIKFNKLFIIPHLKEKLLIIILLHSFKNLSLVNTCSLCSILYPISIILLRDASNKNHHHFFKL